MDINLRSALLITPFVLLLTQIDFSSSLLASGVAGSATNSFALRAQQIDPEEIDRIDQYIDRKNLKALESLLASGANPNAPGDDDAPIPILIAAATGGLESIRLLVHYGAAIDVTNSIGETPLLLAADGGYNAIIAFLIKHGAALNAQDHAQTAQLSLPLSPSAC